ncbi:MAG: DUF1501 domain-containing protein, partial [Fimbriiglobus sp.]|nr:DUF1501 domain-containing protein [Fimbriiglobus sp.]
MLSFCSPGSRREFLRVGGLALGGLTLSHTLARGGSPLSSAGGPLTDKCVIFLFLHGGPSQIETFDPKMGAAAEVRSATGEVKTVLPGVTFGGTFPKLAARADRLSVVRSFVTGDGNHDIKPVVGKDTAAANLGSAYASVAGSTRENGMPTNVALFPQSIDPKCQPMQTGFGNFLASGPFGPAGVPFVPGSGGPAQKNLTLGIPQTQLGDRRALLAAFDGAKGQLDATSADLDDTRQKAFSLLLGNAAEAFDLKTEDPKVIARYDTEPLYDVTKIDKKWNNHKFYTDNA